MKSIIAAATVVLAYSLLLSGPGLRAQSADASKAVLIEKAELKIKAKKFQDAVDVMQTLHKTYGADSETHHLLAKAYLGNRELEKAKKSVERAMAATPERLKTYSAYRRMAELAAQIDREIVEEQAFQDRQRKRAEEAEATKDERAKQAEEERQRKEREARMATADADLLKAAQEGDLDGIKEAITYGGNPIYVEKEDHTYSVTYNSPLLYAIYNLDLEMTDFLLEMGANPNNLCVKAKGFRVDMWHTTLFEYACGLEVKPEQESQVIAVMQLLLKHEAKVNTDCLLGALKNGSQERVKLVLDNGGKPKDKVNEYENHAFYWAKKWGKSDYIPLLKQYK